MRFAKSGSSVVPVGQSGSLALGQVGAAWFPLSPELEAEECSGTVVNGLLFFGGASFEGLSEIPGSLVARLDCLGSCTNCRV